MTLVYCAHFHNRRHPYLDGTPCPPIALCFCETFSHPYNQHFCLDVCVRIYIATFAYNVYVHRSCSYGTGAVFAAFGCFRRCAERRHTSQPTAGRMYVGYCGCMFPAACLCEECDCLHCFCVLFVAPVCLFWGVPYLFCFVCGFWQCHFICRFL